MIALLESFIFVDTSLCMHTMINNKILARWIASCCHNMDSNHVKL